MTDTIGTETDPLERVLRYHDETKHHFQRYAPGPGYLEWATQPDPFRRYAGARLLPLEKPAPADAPRYDDAFVEGRLPPAPVARWSISQLFFDSLAISAWKSVGDVRWALRANPSSGNLHPTEGYLICGPLEDLCEEPVIAHYAPEVHGLEVRAEVGRGLWDHLCAELAPDTFFVGLSSILWREAWKYGQRAYRYCQHDIGHAIGAVSIAAAGLGWTIRIVDGLSTEALGLLMGTSHPHDAEPEEPELLMAVGPAVANHRETRLPADAIRAFEQLDWRGRPNQLSPTHVDWGVDAAAALTRLPTEPRRYEAFHPPPRSVDMEPRPLSLRRIIRQRRSAVAMDGQTRLTRTTFDRMLSRTLPVQNAVPFTTFSWTPHIHLAIFVHRVDDLTPGLYVLVRDQSQTASLQQAFTKVDRWDRVTGGLSQLHLYRLVAGDTQQAARQVSCHQDIAADGCFSLGMVAEYEAPLTRYGPWFYPRLFWEAGAIGQVLYLEAEAAGLRSTGIGCYFDDAMHGMLGVKDRTYQDLYHFTIGAPVEDTRLTTLPSYPDG